MKIFIYAHDALLALDFEQMSCLGLGQPLSRSVKGYIEVTIKNPMY